MARKRVYIVGAGASAAQPAGLPLFNQLRSSLLDSLDLEGEVAEYASRLAPETFMRALHDGGLPLTAWLTDTLGVGEPNAVHVALATAHRHGATVWTVNIDELIERALGDSADNLTTAFPASAPDKRRRIVKPHGTISGGAYVFRSEQVVRPLPEPWAQRLHADLADADVTILGYQGADIDLRLALGSALDGAANITWYTTRSAQQSTLDRFPVLNKFSTWRTGGEDPAELSVMFLQDATADGLADDVTDQLRSLLGKKPEPSLHNIEGRTMLARALIEERCGARDDARAHYLSAALHPASLTSAALAVRGRLRIDCYTPTRSALFAYRWADSPLAFALPTPVRRYLDRSHVTLLSSHEGRHDDALDRASRVLNPSDPAILIAKSKAERFRGEMGAAAAHALEVRDIAQPTDGSDGLPDDLAHALYELVFIDTWRGRFTDARTTLRSLTGGVDALAGVRWIAWATWQLGCLEIYANRPDDALSELRSARELFIQDGLVAGEVSALSVQLTALRMLGDPTFADRRVELRTFRGQRGWTDYTDRSLRHEDGEWARLHGRHDEARAELEALYAHSASEPIHRAIACLSLAELARTEGHDGSGFRAEASQIAEDHELSYVAAHAVIAEHLADQVDAQAAIEQIAATGAELATRHGGPAHTPADYCIGTRPDLHEIYLP